MKGIPTNIPDLEELCPICLLTKATKIPICPTIDVLEISPGFIIQMDFSFFNVERICVFISTFMAICSSTSYLFGFISSIKQLTLDILKLLVTILRNQDKKVVLFLVGEDGSLKRFSELMRIFHNMNMLDNTTGGYAS